MVGQFLRYPQEPRRYDISGLLHNFQGALHPEALAQKAQNFRTMTQGAISVEEYFQHFVKMMRYAPNDTRTDDDQ